MSDATGLSRSDLIFNWNARALPPRPTHPVSFDDETLRDGLQSPSVCNPTIAEKLAILHVMATLGIQAADLVTVPYLARFLID